MGVLEQVKQLVDGYRMERRLQRDRDILLAAPQFIVDAKQRKMMDVAAAVTGLKVVSDKFMAFRFVGSKLSSFKGAFCQSRHNPHLKQDLIVMNCETNDPYWYSVLFHELAHATGSRRFLNRHGLNSPDEGKTSMDYDFEELIAEGVARQIMEHFGMATNETRSRSACYIDAYERSYGLDGLFKNGFAILGVGQLFKTNEIDRVKLDAEIYEAKALVMYWLRDFDTVTESVLAERVKEFNQFF